MIPASTKTKYQQRVSNGKMELKYTEDQRTTM